MNEEKQKLIAVLDQYKKSTNTADAKLAASLYTEDAIMIPAGFPTNVGNEAIFNFYSNVFSLLQLTLEFEIDQENILIEGDVAYATTSSIGTRLMRETGETVPEINRELWIFRKIDSEWKIARYMFNVPPKKES